MAWLRELAPGFLAGFVYYYVFQRAVRSAQRPAERQGERGVLRYGLFLPILGWANVAAGAALVVIAVLLLLYGDDKADAAGLLGIICLPLTASAVYCLGEAYWTRIEFDGEGIYTHSLWRPDREIPWDDIRGYSFSSRNNWHILETESHGRIRLDTLLVGLGSFFDELRKRRTWQAIEPLLSAEEVAALPSEEAKTPVVLKVWTK